jgi:hypothetical protein
MKTTRSRPLVLNRSKNLYGLRNLTFPFFDFENDHEISLQTTQYTESEGHYYGLIGQDNVDIGGEFLTRRSTHYHNSPYIEVWTGLPNNSSFFKGRVFPETFVSDSDVGSSYPIVPSSRIELDALGTTAIAQTIPTNPVVSLATFFGELREGFPKMIGSSLFKSRLRNLRKGVGNEYLNWEFGWKPMISDLTKWVHAARNADKLWAQFVRDSGRRVRRRYTFPKSETVESSTTDHALIVLGMASNVPGFWQGGSNIFPRFYEKREIRRRWFSGAFTYHADVDPDVLKTWKGHLQRLDKLYGVKITPEVLWNLAPWSWAADWFTNSGDVIHNISRFSEDSLVMPYGYMMENSIRQDTYRMKDVTPKGYHIPDLTEVFTTNVKYRIQATPYGFGFDLGDLSPRQLAIITALGLSRR